MATHNEFENISFVAFFTLDNVINFLFARAQFTKLAKDF